MDTAFAADAALDGVQGVECSNHSVPTNRIKELEAELYKSPVLYIRRLSNICTGLFPLDSS